MTIIDKNETNDELFSRDEQMYCLDEPLSVGYYEIISYSLTSVIFKEPIYNKVYLLSAESYKDIESAFREQLGDDAAYLTEEEAMYLDYLFPDKEPESLKKKQISFCLYSGKLVDDGTFSIENKLYSSFAFVFTSVKSFKHAFSILIGQILTTDVSDEVDLAQSLIGYIGNDFTVVPRPTNASLIN